MGSRAPLERRAGQGRPLALTVAVGSDPRRQERSRETDAIAHRQSSGGTGWWRLLLAALAAVLVGLLGAGSASATTLPGLETRVGTSPVVAQVTVGVHECITAGQRWAKAPPQAETVAGSCVAANAGTRSIDDLLRPGGLTIGKAGTDDTIRELTGGLPEAQTMFQQLSHGGTVVAQTPKLTRVELPNGGGFVQLRTVMSRSPNTAATIDVNIPGLDIRKLKYNP